jgi:hypothetical protein
MPLVRHAKPFACRAERLAGARPRPNCSIVRPPSSAQGKGPDANSCEEMALFVSAQVVGFDIFYAPFVYVARRYVPGCY